MTEDEMFEQDQTAMAAARERDKQAAVQANFPKPQGQDNLTGFGHWLVDLPKNVGVGLLDAAVNTADAIDWFGGEVGENFEALAGPSKSAQEAGAVADPAAAEKKFMEAQAKARAEGDGVFAPARDAYMAWRDDIAQSNSTADDITQGIAQYAIPFLGWSKLMGGLRAASTLGTVGKVVAAESLTSATALAPNAPRAADMLAMGKQVENKFGQAMNRIAPDGSLLNAYIDYMTSRDGTEGENRFRNVVDNLALTGAGAALLKTTALSLKSGRYMLEQMGAGPSGLAAQKGMVTFHGTPHKFDEFDINKIGTGEGAQVYGHGLYFAENPAVANTYRGGGDIVYRIASANLFKHKGDWQKAVADLKSRNDNTSSFAARMIEQGKGQLAKGNLYTVDIPDEVAAKMMEWDKPWAEQPANVQAALSQAMREFDITPSSSRAIARDVYDKLAVRMAGSSMDGKIGQKKASEYLDAAGVPGIKYLDGQSRGKGEGTRNIVLFDPKHAKIIKKE